MVNWLVKPIPKPKRYENQAYLDWVRAHPCASCGKGGPSDPHHFGRGGVGTKSDDTWVVPLCRVCHTLQHGGNGMSREEMLWNALDLITEYWKQNE